METDFTTSTNSILLNVHISALHELSNKQCYLLIELIFISSGIQQFVLHRVMK